MHLLLVPLGRVPLRWALGALLLLGCGKGDFKAPRLEDAGFTRRVFEPPPSVEVRAVPPHNIHRSGVGPYELSASFQTTLALLPTGPRVERFEADGLFDYRLMRTDSDALLIGVGRRNQVSFISVLDPDIARTESGIGVGAGVEELVGALGAVLTPADTGSDPRIVTFTALPDTRFIVEQGKVVAAVVMSPSEAEQSKPDPNACKADELKTREGEIRALAKQDNASILWACLNTDSGEAVLRVGDRLKVIGTQTGVGPLRVLGTTTVPGLDFIAALNTGGARRELYSVSRRQSAKALEVLVTRYKVSNGRIVPIWSRTAFSLEASAASWLGAKLSKADFLLELRGRDRLVELSGIYLQRGTGLLRNVVPINSIGLLDPHPTGNATQNSGNPPTTATPTQDGGASSGSPSSH